MMIQSVVPKDKFAELGILSARSCQDDNLNRLNCWCACCQNRFRTLNFFCGSEMRCVTHEYRVSVNADFGMGLPGILFDFSVFANCVAASVWCDTPAVNLNHRGTGGSTVHSINMEIRATVASLT